MVGVALEGERRGCVPCGGLEVPYGLPTARQKASVREKHPEALAP